MKKTNRKRLGLEHEVVKVLIAANLKHVQGGITISGTTYITAISCYFFCGSNAADGCLSNDLCEQ